MSHLLNVYATLDLDLSHGEGNTLYTKDGHAYLDTFSGIAVNTLGHRHPALDKALIDHSGRFLHVSNFFRTDAQETLAKKLCDLSFAEKVFFANSGTEANEAALKLVRKWGRSIDEKKTRILSVESAFHGRSSGGMALTGNPEKRKAFEPTLPGIDHVPFNDTDALEEMFDGSVCAIFLELIYGSSGIYTLSEAFLKKVDELSKRHNALVVIDEVQTGLRRTGPFFAYEKKPVEPDLVTLAKGLGGGLPLGAMLVSPRLTHVLGPGDHGTTFGGNPLACALGVAVLDAINEEGFVGNLNEAMAYLNNAIHDLGERYPDIIREIRGEGFMLGIDVGAHAKAMQEHAQTQGVLLNVTAGSVIRLLPSLTFSTREIDALRDALEKTFLMI